jgi:hypothetical protein
MVLSDEPLMSLRPTTTTACTIPPWPTSVFRVLNVARSQICCEACAVVRVRWCVRVSEKREDERGDRGDEREWSRRRIR